MKPPIVGILLGLILLISAPQAGQFANAFGGYGNCFDFSDSSNASIDPRAADWGVLWRTRLAGPGRRCNFVVNDTFFTRDQQGSVYALNALTGELLWQRFQDGVNS